MTQEIDRGKTELTQNVTRLAALWLDSKGFKPVETEVSMGSSRGWVADIAAVIRPTQTECINLKLIKNHPRYEYRRRDNPGYFESYQKKRDEWNMVHRTIPGVMTAIIEVKTSVADFRRDLKWELNGSPTNLKYVAMPTGMIPEEKWPNGWGVILHSGESVRCVRPSPLYQVSTEASRGVILEIAIRRDHSTRYEHLRKLQRAVRIDEAERKMIQRVSNAIEFVLMIQKGYAFGDALAMSGLRCKLPEYVIEKLKELVTKSPEALTIRPART